MIPSGDDTLATGSTIVPLLDVLIQLLRTVGSVAFDVERWRGRGRNKEGEARVLDVAAGESGDGGAGSLDLRRAVILGGVYWVARWIGESSILWPGVPNCSISSDTTGGDDVAGRANGAALPNERPCLPRSVLSDSGLIGDTAD